MSRLRQQCLFMSIQPAPEIAVIIVAKIESCFSFCFQHNSRTMQAHVVQGITVDRSPCATDSAKHQSRPADPPGLRGGVVKRFTSKQYASRGSVSGCARPSDPRSPNQIDGTQAELAARGGITRGYLNGVECGTRNISILNLRKIAMALGSRALPY